MVRSMEMVLGQYARAMAHVSRGYALQEASQLLAVSHGPACPGAADPWASRASSAPEQAETIVAKAPQWGAAVPVPASWRLDREQVRPWRCGACARGAGWQPGWHAGSAGHGGHQPDVCCHPAGRGRDGYLGVCELPAGLRPGPAHRSGHAARNPGEQPLSLDYVGI